MKRSIYILAIVALGLAACNKVNEERVPTWKPASNTETAVATEAPVYHFSIPAGFGEPGTKAVAFGEDGKSITSTFRETDKVYVYNVTKEAWAYTVTSDYNDNKFYDYAYLQPSDLSNEGMSCTLTGDLTFYYFDEEAFEYKTADIDDTDAFDLYYNYEHNGGNLEWDYEFQTGRKEDMSDLDYAKAEGISMQRIGDNLSPAAPVLFQNVGSMFRQRISFTKNGDPVSPDPTGLLYLRIGTEHEIFVSYCQPHSDYDDYENEIERGAEITGNQSVMDANGDVYFALSFDNTLLEAGDKIYFEVCDYAGNVFQCEKALPEGGFRNGKYYYGTLVMEWEESINIPTVTATDNTPILPDNYAYELSDGATISGSSDGFAFYMAKDASHVTLAGNGTATCDWARVMLEGAEDNDLTVTLASDYAFTCTSPHAICTCMNEGENGNLKLATTGGTHKLTITVPSDEYCGLHAYGNFSQGTDEFYVPALAAEGNTVTMTRTNNADGTFTFVYTVSTSPILCIGGPVLGPVEKNADGKYVLENAQEYLVTGNVEGDIVCTGAVYLTLTTGIVIQGCLTVSDGVLLEIDFTGEEAPVTINGTGQDVMALVVNGTIDITGAGRTLILNGSCGNTTGYTNCVNLYLGTWLYVSGNIPNNVEIWTEAPPMWNLLDYDQYQYGITNGYEVFYGGDEEYNPDPDPGPDPEE